MSKLSPEVKVLLDAYYSVYPVSGEYAYQGERLSIAAVLRVLIDKAENFYDPSEGKTAAVLVNDILKIVEELEQF